MDTSSSSRRASAKSGHDLADHEGHEDGRSDRWLISYADVITTMMVLFLALYVLQLAKNKALEIKVFDAHVAGQRTAGAQPDAHPDAAPTPALVQRDRARRELMASLAPLRETSEISVEPVAQGVEIAINAKVLFDSGDAHLRPASFDELSKVALALARHSTRNILVEGHSDNVPIANAKYESNWELSSARAGAVVRFLVERGVEPHRLAAVGRADNVPLVIGDDAAARAANRRVTILVQD
ncbi:chemotaxis protein MotB [Paraburkholderia kururiensis]|uniref:OmpA family protein n=1 Tax=Paraburkholderia kururiensis TaxID=984307 RepID=UPI0039A6A7DA